jgi:hypothetical protein
LNLFGFLREKETPPAVSQQLKRTTHGLLTNYLHGDVLTDDPKSGMKVVKMLQEELIKPVFNEIYIYM